MSDTEQTIADIINGAEAFHEPKNAAANDLKPRLRVDRTNPDITVAALSDILAKRSSLYDRGIPVRLAPSRMNDGRVIHAISPEGLIHEIHTVSRPYEITPRGEERDVGFPRNLAAMYLDRHGEWNLPPLAGITSAPLLHEDGSISATEGYEPNSGMWVESDPGVAALVPQRPTEKQARSALALIREFFKTFCFADAELVSNKTHDANAAPAVDTSKSPGKDESAFLIALLTAVCRASLAVAPGILLRAAAMSGAGTGKGLLARSISLVAFGREPRAVTGGGSIEEIEKRISAELMEGHPILFLDNLNNMNFKSDLLASVITEHPARVRILGKSQMVTLNASALVILTGNGLTVSEDLARRFITVELDARTEEPEARAFTGDIKSETRARRRELLVALLTIWRWGRQMTELNPGIPFGSFEQWGRWVRDPMIALGCQDPADSVGEAKQRDSRRQFVVDLFEVWSRQHGERSIQAAELHDEVRAIIDPHKRGRQYVVAQLEKLAGTRLTGFQMQQQMPPGKWGRKTYALVPTGSHEARRDHRGHGFQEPAATAPVPPMPLMHSNTGDDAALLVPTKWSARL